VAVGVLLVAVGVAAFAGGKSDRDSPQPSALSAPPPQGGKEVVHRETGVTLDRPPGWSVSRTESALVFRSRDRSAVLSIFSPSRAPRGAAAVLQSGLREIRSSYSDIEARPGDGRRVAGLPTSAVVVSARNRRGVPVRILVAAAQGRRRAWLVQVFTGAEGSTARLVEAQVALGSLMLEG
jgi:hypothetical protein